MPNAYNEKEKKKEQKPRGVVANVLDCDIILRGGFQLQLHYHTHFLTNNLRKGIIPHLTYGLNCMTFILLQEYVWL